LLEASQIIYWVVLTALTAGLPEAVLAMTDALSPEPPKAANEIDTRLRDASHAWRAAPPDPSTLAARLQSTLKMTATACAARNVDPVEALERDLRDLRDRPYLAPYFAETGS